MKIRKEFKFLIGLLILIISIWGLNVILHQFDAVKEKSIERYLDKAYNFDSKSVDIKEEFTINNKRYIIASANMKYYSNYNRENRLMLFEVKNNFIGLNLERVADYRLDGNEGFVSVRDNFMYTYPYTGKIYVWGNNMKTHDKIIIETSWDEIIEVTIENEDYVLEVIDVVAIANDKGQFGIKVQRVLKEDNEN